uniref:Uncharacterized protein n=1 Tax=Mycena chlorophos TaxID=658473 RepID=A0ABQ0LWD8_MYCCL|nr:predicted protein [Mycena chlorophos]
MPIVPHNGPERHCYSPIQSRIPGTSTISTIPATSASLIAIASNVAFLRLPGTIQGETRFRVSSTNTLVMAHANLAGVPGPGICTTTYASPPGPASSSCGFACCPCLDSCLNHDNAFLTTNSTIRPRSPSPSSDPRFSPPIIHRHNPHANSAFLRRRFERRAASTLRAPFPAHSVSRTTSCRKMVQRRGILFFVCSDTTKDQEPSPR